MATRKKTFHEAIADKLIELLQQGAAPWQREWGPGPPLSLMPLNPVTGERYRGINAIQLLSENRNEQRWLTHSQASAAGAEVRHGEQSTPIIYWEYSEQRNRTDAEGRLVLDASGAPVRQDVKLERPRLVLAAVFNADQINGLPQFEPVQQSRSAEERAGQNLKASGALTGHGNVANREQFATADLYYAAARHELRKWYGNLLRLAGDIGHPVGSPEYEAREKLREEIASMILGDELGLGHVPNRSPGCVEAWIKLLQDDPLALFRAASEAEELVFHVLSQKSEQEQEQEQDQEQARQLSEGELDIVARRFELLQGEPAGKREAQALAAASERHLNITLPHDWNGGVKLVGYLYDSLNGRSAIPASGAAGGEPQFWDVYIERTGGRLQWVSNFPTRREAEHLCERLTLIDAWSQPDEREQAARLDRIFGPATVDQAATHGHSHGRQALAVPYRESALAKASGAVWDTAAGFWHAGPQADARKLQRWLPDPASGRQAPAMSAREEFADALRAAGCHVDGDHPILNGKKQGISVAGDKPGEQSGFYIARMDGHPAGHIKNCRTGVEVTWKSKGYILAPEQRAQMRADAANRQQARATALETQYEQIAQEVSQHLGELHPVVQPTPYMQSKGIAPQPGAFTDREGRKTCLPTIDADGRQWSMLTIHEDGTREFPKGCRKDGCFHPIGGLDAVASAPVLVIASGYASACSLSETLGFAAVATLELENLPAVAKALHHKFPDKPVILACDDEQRWYRGLALSPNAAKIAFERVASEVDGIAVFPIFAQHEQAAHPGNFTDFNDLATKSALGRYGIERQARAAVRAAEKKYQQAVRKKQMQAQKPLPRQLRARKTRGMH